MIKDLLEGIYSGIPLCCVISYSRGRYGFVAAKEHGGWDKYLRRNSAEYVQCKRCEKKGKVVSIRYNGSLFDRKSQ